jgi:hypothetical protein
VRGAANAGGMHPTVAFALLMLPPVMRMDSLRATSHCRFAEGPNPNQHHAASSPPPLQGAGDSSAMGVDGSPSAGVLKVIGARW